MPRRRLQQLLLLAGMIAGFSSGASDLAREQRLAAQIVDAIFDGEPVSLHADGRSFLGIHTGAQAAPSGRGAIILHGRGYHPDWEQVVRPLRVGLAERGWNTLSLQMPVLDKQAKYYDYVEVFPEAAPRIEAGIHYLAERGNDTIVLIAHSCAVHMSMDWVRESGAPGIDGYVGIGMGATDYKQPMRAPFPFERLTVPVLDLYGERDYPAVLRGAPERRKAIAAAGNPASRQKVIAQADHDMHDSDAALLDAVSDWLDATFGDAREPGP